VLTFNYYCCNYYYYYYYYYFFYLCTQHYVKYLYNSVLCNVPEDKESELTMINILTSCAPFPCSIIPTLVSIPKLERRMAQESHAKDKFYKRLFQIAFYLFETLFETSQKPQNVYPVIEKELREAWDRFSALGFNHLLDLLFMLCEGMVFKFDSKILVSVAMMWLFWFKNVHTEGANLYEELKTNALYLKFTLAMRNLWLKTGSKAELVCNLRFFCVCVF